MPYRRLPNTDQTRLSALQKAVQRASEADYSEQALDFQTLQEAQRFLMQFQMQMGQYHNNRINKVSENREYRLIVQNTRMYISHFIQVLNLAFIRGEIKKDYKELYGLETDSHAVPDLTTEEDLLYWGEKIINGENERISKGGFPIYNPTINKVKGYYDNFKEQQPTHSYRQQTTYRAQENVEGLRTKADELIVRIWNQVENFYKEKLPFARLNLCKQYGLIYYYRTGEKRLSAETDKAIETQKRSQTTIQWT